MEWPIAGVCGVEFLFILLEEGKGVFFRRPLHRSLSKNLSKNLTRHINELESSILFRVWSYSIAAKRERGGGDFKAFCFSPLRPHSLWEGSVSSRVWSLSLRRFRNKFTYLVLSCLVLSCRCRDFVLRSVHISHPVYLEYCRGLFGAMVCIKPPQGAHVGGGGGGGLLEQVCWEFFLPPDDQPQKPKDYWLAFRSSLPRG